MRHPRPPAPRIRSAAVRLPADLRAARGMALGSVLGVACWLLIGLAFRALAS
jgi:hypothetical protein